MRVAFVTKDRTPIIGVRELLEGEGYTVETHQDATKAAACFATSAPDIAVIQSECPGIKPIEFIDKARSAWSPYPVMVLTSAPDEIDEILMLRMGAMDYVKQDVSARVLRERILRAARDGKFATGGQSHANAHAAPGEVVSVGNLSIDVARNSVCWKGTEVIFTLRETMLIHALARRPGIIWSRTQLMDHIGLAITTDDRAIDSFVKRIRANFRNVDKSFNMIKTVYGGGYRIPEA